MGMKVILVVLFAMALAMPIIAKKGKRVLGSCNISKNGKCGSGNANTYCNAGAFCSRYGWCGVGAAWSAKSGNSKFDGSVACVKAQSLPKSRIVKITNV